MNILDSISTDPPEPSRTWSIQQTDFFDAVREKEQNLQLSAVAGSGKTTTLVNAVRVGSGRSLFLAFNRDIAKEIDHRLNGSGTARTLNSLGHGLLMKNFSDIQLAPDKLSILIKELVPDEVRKEHFRSISSLVGLAKNNNLPINASNWDFEDLSISLDISAQDVAEVALYAKKVFTQSIARTETFDWDDQVYLPIHFNLEFPSYQNVLCDEDQDLSPINHAALKALNSAGARLIGVGDEYQAIYGFRGALCDSIPQLVGKFNMKTFPLSTTYRCPQAVVKEARAICPHILARENAPEGEVLWSEEDPKLFSPTSMVLCRTNAPLFAAVMRQVRAKEPCRVYSNAIDSLITWIRKLRAQNITQLQEKAEAEFAKEVAEIMNQPRPQLGRIRNLEDRLLTLKELCKGSQAAQDVVDLLVKLKNSTTGPIFATIHKAKGLEAPDVYLLRPDLCPAPWVDTNSPAYQQELNLLYVAITRAQESFTYGAEA